MGQYQSAADFEKFFHTNYIPLTYEDVKSDFETFYKEQNGKIFHEDYEKAAQISRDDFRENLSKTALFTFQDTLTELFYEKNPTIYEEAFAIFEENGGTKSEITKIFDDTYQSLYEEFLNQFFDEVIAPAI